MRRRVAVRVSVALAIGLVTSVLVAIGCAIYPSSEPKGFYPHPGGIELAAKMWRRWEGGALTEDVATLSDGVAVLHRSEGCCGQITEVISEKGFLFEFRFGWPVTCLQGALANRRAQPGGPIAHYHRRNLIVASASDCYIPTAPYWPGLMIDTLLFAVAWLVLATIPARLRRWRRARRGVCTQCAYPRNGDRPCPECGAPGKAGVALAGSCACARAWGHSTLCPYECVAPRG